MTTPAHTRRPRHWWAPPVLTAAAAAALLGFMTWQVTVRGPFIAWDWSFHEYADAHHPNGWAKSTLDWIARLTGQRLYTLPVITGVGVWVSYRQRRLRPLIAIGAGLATVGFVGYWIKFGLARTPPASGVDMLHGVGQAFPSGHTANATLTWIFLVIVLFGSHGLRPDPARVRRWMTAAVILVFTAGALMTALDYHWLSDIPGGWALGLLALMVATTVLDAPLLRHRYDVAAVLGCRPGAVDEHAWMSRTRQRHLHETDDTLCWDAEPLWCDNRFVAWQRRWR